MWSLLRRNPLAVLLAVMLHALLVALLIWGGLTPTPPPPQGMPEVQVVQAQIVDKGKVQQEIAKLKQAE